MKPNLQSKHPGNFYKEFISVLSHKEHSVHIKFELFYDIITDIINDKLIVKAILRRIIKNGIIVDGRDHRNIIEGFQKYVITAHGINAELQILDDCGFLRSLDNAVNKE